MLELTSLFFKDFFFVILCSSYTGKKSSRVFSFSMILYACLSQLAQPFEIFLAGLKKKLGNSIFDFSFFKRRKTITTNIQALEDKKWLTFKGPIFIKGLLWSQPRRVITECSSTSRHRRLLTSKKTKDPLLKPALLPYTTYT